LKADLIRMALDKYHLQLPTGSPKRAIVEQTVCCCFNRVDLVRQTQSVCDFYIYFKILLFTKKYIIIQFKRTYICITDATNHYHQFN
jgi:hypothetical protein